MPPQVNLNKQLALFNFLLSKFGFSEFRELQNQYKTLELDSNIADSSLFFNLLSASSAFIPTNDLKQFDANLISHLQKINTSRQTPIKLKYYQYFSLLFTEYYLDRYFSAKHDLLDELNLFISNSTKPNIKALPSYKEEELNKLAYWNATGSGKTFILHINILQSRYYITKYSLNVKNFILLTPGEDLSAQHLAEVAGSGISANYYAEDKESENVKIIDVHKIREYSSGQGVTFPRSEFGGLNVLFVDEGHKGDKSEDSVFREIRNKLSSEGFAFEYSATFGQMSDAQLLKEYGKCTAFDYSYGHFYEDGYGKDYWIHNLNADLSDEDKKRQYLLQNMLLFTQQKIYYSKFRAVLTPYEIENPLLLFVGSSVEPKPSSKDSIKENKDVISDVKTVLDFFNDFLNNREKYIVWINALKGNSDDALFKSDYYSKLHYLFGEIPDGRFIYEFCLKSVFNHSTGGELELYTLRNAEGEIALKIRNADHYFALIYIGDTSAFKAPIKDSYNFKNDVQSSSLFSSLSDRNDYPVNIMIGARKFIEGWNSFRVSSIGLINFGKSKGSQIIQLFGRGVRLKGKESSLKRSKNQPGSPADIHIVECLNIFGLKADYMSQFKKDLEKEGIKTLRRQFSFPVKLNHDLPALKLLTLERNIAAPKYEETDILKLENLIDENGNKLIKVRVDISTKKFVAIAGNQHVDQHITTHIAPLNPAYYFLVNWDWIYTELLLYKKRMASPRMPNLLIPRNSLPQLITQIDYKIISDSEFIIKQLSDIEKLNKLVLQVLRKYVELFYKHHLQFYDGNNLSEQVLTKDNANLVKANWEFEIITTDAEENELTGIQAHLQHITNVLADATYPVNLKGDTHVLNSWIAAHIYQPLFKDEDAHKNIKAGGVSIIESIKPPALNTGEYTFVEHLRTFILNQGNRYPDYDFYLLRNMSRGTGFGFYFLSGGFYPDFMLWLKHKTTGKQFLTFIDPHGLRNEDTGWDSPKINLHKTIKELQTQLANENLVLNSFVLQPPPNDLAQTGLNNWHRDDDPTRAIALDIYAATHHVFAIPSQGNAGGIGGYIYQMISKILS